MKAHGTNTADSTRATAITGPDTSSIARAVASRASGATAEARITALYKTLFGRGPTAQELALGRGYVTAEERWPLYTQALLSSNEFLFVN